MFSSTEPLGKGGAVEMQELRNRIDLDSWARRGAPTEPRSSSSIRQGLAEIADVDCFFSHFSVNQANDIGACLGAGRDNLGKLGVDKVNSGPIVGSDGSRQATNDLSM
jgi:hypothetical protein